jgi:phage I-like protein
MEAGQGWKTGPVSDLPTRAGGERNIGSCNVNRLDAVKTAGAPAHHLIVPVSGGMQVEASEPPEWIELIPAGEFVGRDGRGPFRLVEPARVIAATLELRMAGGIPVDYDHATDFAAPRGEPAPAAGWITELAARDGAIWGRVAWTERAREKIGGREYRFISPVFQYSSEDGRVTRLLRAGLTNNPNLYLGAISAADGEEVTMEETLKELREVLGLAADAAPAAVIAKVRELVASSRAAMAAGARGPDPAKYVAMAEFERALTELNRLRAEHAREQAEREVDDAVRMGKLVPAQRAWAVEYCAADPRGFGAFVAKQPAVAGSLTGAAAERWARDTGFAQGPRLSTAELTICAQLGVDAEEFSRRKAGRADFLRLNRADED